MRVLAALSGGVDSAVVAAKAVETGYGVVGVHMTPSSQPQECRIGSRGCCSIEDADDAACAAGIIGIPFYAWDLVQEPGQTVITDSVAQYKAGRTSNPCVRYNEFVKFHEPAIRARALGFNVVCTGHYAVIVDGAAGPELHRDADNFKDQSYVLTVMGPEEFHRVVLPLGDAPNKAWARPEAKCLDLGVSNKPDSYSICFIPDGDMRGFLRAHLGAAESEIITPDGEVPGRHEGYWNHTVGQRKGLGTGAPVPGGCPCYVLETRPETNQVVVGASELLSISRITITDAVWLASDDDGSDATGLFAQLHAHGTLVPIVLLTRDLDAETIGVILVSDARGVARDQSMIIYWGTRVLGKGTIDETGR